MSKFDLFILGQPCMDINVDFTGAIARGTGGAVVYSGYSAASTGAKVAVLPKCNPSDVDIDEVFSRSRGVTIFHLDSPSTTSIQNVYHTADRERRTCTALGMIPPYHISEIPDVDASIWQIAGLIYGDLDQDIIQYASEHAMAAVDVQFLLRRNENGNMVYYDWDNKLKYLPMIRFLKTDAAEAEVLTGLTDRVAAAKQLYAWGAKEVVITHNTEALVYDGNEIYTVALKPRNLTGRTGRGDTMFAAYLCERLHKSIPEALEYASALVSLKMETVGPFMGDRADVDAYIQEFYR